MKKIALCILLCCGALAFAETNANANDATGLAFDYALAGRPNDFGMSLGVASPWLFHNSLAVRTSASGFFPNEKRSKPYYVLDLALMGGTLMRTANIRLYGGGGPLFVFPAAAGEPTVRITGEGFFGFEFFMGKRPADFSLFAEMGGGGLGFTAKTGIRYTIPMLTRRAKPSI
ncbi:MAG: hypothetical protein ACTTKL_10155 [Treponema sp.]